MKVAKSYRWVRCCFFGRGCALGEVVREGVKIWYDEKGAGDPLVLIGGVGHPVCMWGEALGMLTLSLLLGTPALSGIGAIGAALTLGVRGGGVLLSLLILPLYIPVLIFGSGAVEAVVAGMSAQAHLSLLGALTLGSVFFAPWPTAAALRIALE